MRLGLASDWQVAEAFRRQDETHDPLITILTRWRLLPETALKPLLDAHARILNAAVHPDVITAGKRFAEWITREKAVGEHLVARAVEIQSRRMNQGIPQPLAKIMVELGFMSISQVLRVLEHLSGGAVCIPIQPHAQEHSSPETGTSPSGSDASAPPGRVDEEEEPEPNERAPSLVSCKNCNKLFRAREESDSICPVCGGALDREVSRLSGIRKEFVSQADANLTRIPATAVNDNCKDQKRFGKFVVLKELGRGGMGVVYSAWDTALNRPVALKTILSADERLRMRFDFEARALASLRHPGIVAVYEYGLTDTTPYIAMELIHGKPLDQVIQERGITELETIAVGRRICRAMTHAHSRNILHRDLKPANIIVPFLESDLEDEDVSDSSTELAFEQAKVADFGLARDMGRETVTAPGHSLGTPSYMSPEQAGGKSDKIDERSDVYAIGAILYECLVGRPPHVGESWGEIIVSILTRPVLPPSQVAQRSTSSSLNDIVMQALHKKPENRFQTVRDFLNSLNAWEPTSSAPVVSPIRTRSRGAPSVPREDRSRSADVEANVPELRFSGWSWLENRLRCELRWLYHKSLRVPRAVVIGVIVALLGLISWQFSHQPNTPRGAVDPPVEPVLPVKPTESENHQIGGGATIVQDINVKEDDAGRLPYSLGDRGDRTEGSVQAGLQWLARHQQADGSWAAGESSQLCDDPACGRVEDKHQQYAVGLTGLSLLAFVGAGYTHQSKESYTDPITGKEMNFGRTVKEGLRWLIKNQNDLGRFGDNLGHRWMYNHAIAAQAMAEAYGITSSPLFKGFAQKGIDFLVASQNVQGGWGHYPGHRSDTSVTGWAILALRSAEISGLTIDHADMERARAFCESVTEARYGRCGYTERPTRPPTLDSLSAPADSEPNPRAFRYHPTTTAIGMVVRVFVHQDIKDPILDLGSKVLVQDLPVWEFGNKTNDYYYWHWGTLALFQFDGPDSGNRGSYWKHWNKSTVEAVVKNQDGSASGCAHGSWSSDDRWGHEGGRVYATAINTLTLEVYYRYDNAFGIGKRK